MELAVYVIITVKPQDNHLEGPLFSLRLKGRSIYMLA